LVVVSEKHMLAYTLNNSLDGQKLLQDIQNLINKTNHIQDRVMIIDIKQISQESSDHIKKIEHKTS